MIEPPASASNLSFGPVIELVVNDMVANTNNLLDLDSGTISTFPPSIVDYRMSDAASWYRKNGVDVMGRTQNSPLLGRGLIAHRVPAEWWNNLTAEQLETFLVQSTHEQVTVETVLNYVDGATFLFKTREGSVGLLQDTGFTENPRGVKLRYKLVQNKSDKTAAKQNSASEPSDLREARARLAELRVDYAEQNLTVQKALARVKELERITRDEPNTPADLREAKAQLAELRVSYAEQNPEVQKALARIKVLEQK
jgi:hypothetical protein